MALNCKNIPKFYIVCISLLIFLCVLLISAMKKLILTRSIVADTFDNNTSVVVFLNNNCYVMFLNLNQTFHDCMHFLINIYADNPQPNPIKRQLNIIKLQNLSPFSYRHLL